jgi:Trypsin-co-occurring domain 2
MAEHRIPLAEVLNYVSAELWQAHTAATERGNALMQFHECELEFALDVEVNAEGGFHVWVMKLGGGAKRTESNTIKIKYTALEGNRVVAPVLKSEDGGETVITRQGQQVNK